MAPYQERVVAEKVDLDEKIDKLTRIRCTDGLCVKR